MGNDIKQKGVFRLIKHLLILIVTLIIPGLMIAADDPKWAINTEIEKEEFSTWDVVVSFSSKYSLSLVRYFQQGAWKEISLNRDPATRESILKESEDWSNKILSAPANPYLKGKILSRCFFLGELYSPDKLVTKIKDTENNLVLTITESPCWYIVAFQTSKKIKKTTDTVYDLLSKINHCFNKDFHNTMLIKNPADLTHQIKVGRIMDFLLLEFYSKENSKIRYFPIFCFSKILWLEDCMYILIYKDSPKGLDWGDPSLRKKLGFPQRNWCVLE